MYISANWLRKYLPDFLLTDLEAFKQKVDTRLSEVEAIETKGTKLSKLVTAEIKRGAPHPTSKKLTVCQVDTGEDALRTIVCGAPNAHSGLKTIAVLPGGVVYEHSKQGETIEIGERQMGTILSQGMLCAPSELGISDDYDSIIELPDDTPVGIPVTELFHDIVFEIANKSFPHRPDAFSHLGIARELSAIFKTPISLSTAQLSSLKTEQSLEVKITNQEPTLCPRYSGVSISGVHIGPSPLWLQIALAYAGIKPVNNVVDITNYVMLDIGQPLHAFDLDKLPSKEIVIRKAKNHEKLLTLDGSEHNLTDDVTVIADKDKPIAIAGIMGGEGTKIDEETANVFLESANFEMYSVRRGSHSVGLRTEASTRYEKGQDPANTLPGLVEAAQMMIDVCGGEIASNINDIYPAPEKARYVNFNLNSVQHKLGIELDKHVLLDILESVGLKIKDAERIPADALARPELDVVLTLIIPSYRRDLKIEEDILEEVARLYGYENILVTLPERDLRAARTNKEVEREYTLKEQLAASGLTEIYTYSMVGAELYAKTYLTTENLVEIPEPISPELAYLRDSLVPSLLAKAQQNLSKYTHFGLFETSKIVTKKLTTDRLHEQPKRLAALVVGEKELEVYLGLKQTLEVLSRNFLDNNLQVKPPTGNDSIPPYLHPSKTGRVELKGKSLGFIGIIHPLVTEQFGLTGKNAVVYELELDALLAYTKAEISTLKPVSNYPATQRDLSFWQQERSYVDAFLAKVKELNNPLIDKVEIIDTFIKEKKTSFTLRVTLQSGDHTLSQKEITDSVNEIIALGKELGHKWRSS